MKLKCWIVNFLIASLVKKEFSLQITGKDLKSLVTGPIGLDEDLDLKYDDKKGSLVPVMSKIT